MWGSIFGRTQTQMDKQENRVNKNTDDITDLKVLIEKTLTEFKLEIRNLRSALKNEKESTHKDLDRMANAVEKLENRFFQFTETMQIENRKFAISDAEHSLQIVSLFKIAERANLTTDEERKQLNLYVQNVAGEKNAGQQGPDADQENR